MSVRFNVAAVDLLQVAVFAYRSTCCSFTSSTGHVLLFFSKANLMPHCVTFKLFPEEAEVGSSFRQGPPDTSQN